jgi:tetrahydromethanopterin S-methyltransferase subunit F
MTLLQIAIALAAITLLTRSRYLNYGAIGVAVAGIAVGGLAALHI